MPGFKLFDFDSHYYEAIDAFTRHVDPSLGSRGAGFEVIDGRMRFVVGGRINRYIANPTFDPVARPGALHSWYRGNPERRTLRDAFGELEPIRAEYRNRDRRLAVMDEQGVGATVLFPTLGVGLEEALKDDPEAAGKVFSGFNLWLEDDWGYYYQNRIFAVPYVPLLEPQFAHDELQRLLDRGALVVNIRNAPVPDSGSFRSPFDAAYDPFWGLAADSGVVVATHAGLEGYDVIVNMWENSTESSIFRTPLRGVISKGRAVADFYGAAICQLIFERFPSLRLVSVENGASWVPDLLHRLTDAANRNPGYFKWDPLQTFRDHVWITPFWEDDVAALSEVVAIDQMLLGSDWPHAEGVEQPVDFMNDSLSWADDSTKRRIGRENAEGLIGVTIP
ncbi:MAG: amidohydrolase family protein [Acidimicrobiales bacterium]|jgi:predicted TIM-barrel fold metal-dependent hydrolase